MRTRRGSVATSLALVLTLIVSTAAVAHTPAAGAVRRYSADYQVLLYKFDGSMPSWGQTAANNALTSRWLVNNNSRSPRFQYSASGAAVLSYSTMPDCFGITGWIGCTSGGGSTAWTVKIRSGYVTWCEVSNVTGCYSAQRVFLHEAEHVTLTSSEETQPSTVTNMGPCDGSYCSKAKTNYNSSSPQDCDQAALQVKYAMQDVTGDWSTCLDHVAGHGTNGLVTVHTLSQTTGTTCAGSSISISGRVATQSTSNYGLLSNVNVAGKAIYIDRKLHTSSTWTTDWSLLSTTSATTGNNWTRSFTENPGITQAFDYRVHYKGLVGALAASYSSTFTLTFLKPCPPPAPPP